VDLNPYPIGKTESVQIAMQYCAYRLLRSIDGT
jgi:hypothetical protein